jgi:hypothetical protein
LPWFTSALTAKIAEENEEAMKARKSNSIRKGVGGLTIPSS